MKIIETRTLDGIYGMLSEQAIINHQQHGRLLVCDGYGGENTPSGGCYRWRHGTVNRLLPDDTFEAITGGWNDYTTHMQAILAGHDPDRPLLDWGGFAIEKMMAKQIISPRRDLKDVEGKK